MTKGEKPNRLFQYRDINRLSDGTLEIAGVKGVPDISVSKLGSPAAWFLGPNAENRDILKEMFEQAIDDIVSFREEYDKKNDDPLVIDDTVKNTPEYKNAVCAMREMYSNLRKYLKTYATPYFSMRYQGHMLWDNTLPALAGYTAAMLHNPNNVTIQASTSTTPLAILVGWDLCRMIGFPFLKGVEPWSHITADGTIANIEATWATRESKFLPLALRIMLKEKTTITDITKEGKEVQRALLPAKLKLTVRLCTGKSVLLSKATEWELLNVIMDDALVLPEKIRKLCGVEDDYAVWSAVTEYSFNSQGWMSMMQSAQYKTPIMITPSTRHYSWPKAGAVCGFGSKNVASVNVDENARMSIFDESVPIQYKTTTLEYKLRECLEKSIPITMVVAVVGSTEEGAIDPIEDILMLRETFRKQGLDFCIHVDAAWGGYGITTIRKDYDFEKEMDRAVEEAERSPEMPAYQDQDIFIDDVSMVPLSDYSICQYKLIRRCDTVTIDPHKLGYVQYPAGSLLYRNGVIRRLTTYTGAYIGGTGSVKPGEPTVGIFGIEGSKPGAAAAAVFLSHQVIRPTVLGHGQIMTESLTNTKLFYLKILQMNIKEHGYEVIPLASLPDLDLSVEEIDKIVANRSAIELLQDPQIGPYFRTMGPDLNILDYAFNPKGNTNIDVFQKYNKAIYDELHVHFNPPSPIKDFPRLMITMTTFERNDYGEYFIKSFADRLGLQNPANGKIERLNCLRSVVMDPYLRYTKGGDFFKKIITVLDETAIKYLPLND